MSIELILLAVNLNFIVYSVYLDDLLGQIFALFILTVAAAESAIGLAILVVYYRVRGSIAMETINLMHGLCLWHGAVSPLSSHFSLNFPPFPKRASQEGLSSCNYKKLSLMKVKRGGEGFLG